MNLKLNNRIFEMKFTDRLSILDSLCVHFIVQILRIFLISRINCRGSFHAVLYIYNAV